MDANVVIGDSVIYQTLNDELVLLNMESQQYFGLDDVGADIWQLLLEHKSTDLVATHLLAKYQVDEETARRDVEKLVNELLSAGLVRTATAN